MISRPLGFDWYLGSAGSRSGTRRIVRRRSSPKDLSDRFERIDRQGRSIIGVVRVTSSPCLQNRATGGLNAEKKRYAHEHPPLTDLLEIVRTLQPSFLIGKAPGSIARPDVFPLGAAGQGPVFTRDVLELMATLNARPVIFALSNPTSKAEVTARETYEATRGQAVFASGSPFPRVDYDGKTFVPGQGNNSYIFPGIGLAVVTCAIRHIPEELFYLAAKTLSEQVTDEDLAVGLVYPPIEKIRDVSRRLAVVLAEYAYAHQLAALYPKPDDLDRFIAEQQYTADYEETLPDRWDWSTKSVSKL